MVQNRELTLDMLAEMSEEELEQELTLDALSEMTEEELEAALERFEDEEKLEASVVARSVRPERKPLTGSEKIQREYGIVTGWDSGVFADSEKANAATTALFETMRSLSDRELREVLELDSIRFVNHRAARLERFVPGKKRVMELPADLVEHPEDLKRTLVVLLSRIEDTKTWEEQEEKPKTGELDSFFKSTYGLEFSGDPGLALNDEQQKRLLFRFKRAFEEANVSRENLGEVKSIIIEDGKQARVTNKGKTLRISPFEIPTHELGSVIVKAVEQSKDVNIEEPTDSELVAKLRAEISREFKVSVDFQGAVFKTEAEALERIQAFKRVLDGLSTRDRQGLGGLASFEFTNDERFRLVSSVGGRRVLRVPSFWDEDRSSVYQEDLALWISRIEDIGEWDRSKKLSVDGYKKELRDEYGLECELNDDLAKMGEEEFRRQLARILRGFAESGLTKDTFKGIEKMVIVRGWSYVADRGKTLVIAPLGISTQEIGPQVLRSLEGQKFGGKRERVGKQFSVEDISGRFGVYIANAEGDDVFQDADEKERAVSVLGQALSQLSDSELDEAKLLDFYFVEQMPQFAVSKEGVRILIPKFLVDPNYVKNYIVSSLEKGSHWEQSKKAEAAEKFVRSLSTETVSVYVRENHVPPGLVLESKEGMKEIVALVDSLADDKVVLQFTGKSRYAKTIVDKERRIVRCTFGLSLEENLDILTKAFGEQPKRQEKVLRSGVERLKEYATTLTDRFSGEFSRPLKVELDVSIQNPNYAEYREKMEVVADLILRYREAIQEKVPGLKKIVFGEKNPALGQEKNVAIFSKILIGIPIGSEVTIQDLERSFNETFPLGNASEKNELSPEVEPLVISFFEKLPELRALDATLEERLREHLLAMKKDQERIAELEGIESSLLQIQKLQGGTITEIERIEFV